MTLARRPIPVEKAPVSRVPPNAPDLEEAVLGQIMLEEKAFSLISDILTGDSFYVPAHREVFLAMVDLNEIGQAPNILTVTQQCKKRGTLEDIGGAYFISQLTNKVSAIANIQHHAMIIAQKHMMREMITYGAQVSEAAYDETNDCFDLLDQYEQGLKKCQSYLVPQSIPTAEDGMEDTVNGVSAKFIQFNTPALDGIMIQNGLIHFIGGRPGMGKSIVSTEEAWGWTQYGRVLMFSPEMTRRQVRARIMSRESGVPYSKILAGKATTERPFGMSDDDIAKVAAAHVRVGHRLKRLFIDDTEAITPRQVEAKINRMLADDDIYAVVLDHLHEMTSGFPKIDQSDSSRGKVAYCITQLTRIAKKTNLPFLVFGQMSRATESSSVKEPTIAQISWAGEIEQKAAMILLLYRPGYYLETPPYEDVMKFIFGKYRDGALAPRYSKIIPALSYLGDPVSSMPTPTRNPIPDPHDRPDEETEPF